MLHSLCPWSIIENSTTYSRWKQQRVTCTICNNKIIIFGLKAEPVLNASPFQPLWNTNMSEILAYISNFIFKPQGIIGVESPLSFFQKAEGWYRSIRQKRIIQEREKEREGKRQSGMGRRLNHQAWWKFSSCRERGAQHIVKEIRGIVRGENPFYFNPIWV